MAGNIIHAIATTNAIISGLIVVQALKILTGFSTKCKVQQLDYGNKLHRDCVGHYHIFYAITCAGASWNLYRQEVLYFPVSLPSQTIYPRLFRSSYRALLGPSVSVSVEVEIHSLSCWV